MRHLLITSIVMLLLPYSSSASVDLTDSRLMPDTIVMNNGDKFQGLIVKNDAFEVILQQRMGEIDILKKDILRIEDDGACRVYFAGMITPGTIPPWRMIVMDLRSDDNILSFRQIRATRIDSGYLKNVPYLSFRINKHVEMNVYGNSEDPACLEFGIYEHGAQITRFKKMIRAYLAGILTSRAEIGALYSLSEKGDERRVGKLYFKVLPPTSPDAYKGWWISVFDLEKLDKARLSDVAYNNVANKVMSWSGSISDLRGFYRTKSGRLNLITSSELNSYTTDPTH